MGIVGVTVWELGIRRLISLVGHDLRYPHLNVSIQRPLVEIHKKHENDSVNQVLAVGIN